LPENGGALVLSNVVFTGTLDGNFDAFDAKSGKLLWHDHVGGSVLDSPSSYAVGGKRFVIMDSGAPRQFVVPGMAKTGYVATVTAFSLKPKKQEGGGK
jgi:outer membrane protein assembly factor BamB